MYLGVCKMKIYVEHGSCRRFAALFLVSCAFFSNLASAADSPVSAYHQGFETFKVDRITEAEINAQPDLKWAGGCYSTLLSGFFNKGYDNFKVSSDFSRSGTKSLRFENHVGDRSDSGCLQTAVKSRVEMIFAKSAYKFTVNEKSFSDIGGWDHGAERWIGLSYYLPGTENQKWYASSTIRMIIFQLVGRPLVLSNTDVSPIFHIMVGKNGDLTAEHAYSDATTTEESYKKHPKLANGFKLNEWNDIVIHHKKHYVPNKALIQVWVNGTLWMDFNGRQAGICSAPEKFGASYFKARLYLTLEEPNVYVMYLDDVRIADESGSYNAVAPSNATTTTPPASPTLSVE
ncbi:MAG: heparin lyase I family protein [Gammaproteobacteria bacterium]|nr:heparin lyase I family protein [Gammaproteobacteria bacterium]